jgi:hypothetical protein
MSKQTSNKFSPEVLTMVPSAAVQTAFVLLK